MKVFLDFDDTLFNTRDFIEDFASAFVSLGISSEAYKETRKRAYKIFDTTTSVYDIDTHFAELAVYKPDFDVIQAQQLVEVFLTDTSKYVFDDALQFLKTMNQKHISCYVLSFGQSDFQYKKIHGSGLNDYLQEILIVQNEKHKAVEKYADKDNVWFFDDRADYIDDVKKVLPWVKAVQVSREEGRYHDAKSILADTVIQSFAHMTDASIMDV